MPSPLGRALTLGDELTTFFTAQRLDTHCQRLDTLSVVHTDDDRSLLNTFIAVDDPKTSVVEIGGLLDDPSTDQVRTAVILSDSFSHQRASDLSALLHGRAQSVMRFTTYLDSHLRPDKVTSSLLKAGIDAPNSVDGLLFEQDFIEPWGATGSGRVKALRHLANRWATGDLGRLCMLLAPAGYGKSKLTHILAKRLARRYEQNRASDNPPPIPYLIPFGQYRRTTSFGGLIAEAQNRHGNPLLTTEGFKYLVARGRALFILDGYDELLEQRPETARDNIADFIRSAGASSRILLTARTLFYRTQGDVVGMVGDPDLDADDVEFVDLEPFDKQQAKEFILKKLDIPGDHTRSVERAQEMIDREGATSGIFGSPFFLSEFISLVRTERWSQADINQRDSLRFLIGVAFKRERERQDHTFTDAEQRNFLQEIALDMLRTASNGYDPEELQVFALEAVSDNDDIGERANDRKIEKLLSHHFLTTVGDGMDDFATIKHQVWREFFQGSGLGAALAGQRGDGLEIVMHQDLPQGVVTALVHQLGDSTPEIVSRLSRSANDVCTRNLLRMQAATIDQGSVGQVPLPTWLGAGLRGRHLTELRLHGLSFDGLDLSSANLSGTFFGGCSFRACNFSEALLSRTSFDSCILDETLLQAKNFSCTIAGTDYYGPQLRALFDTEDSAVDSEDADSESMRSYATRILRERLSRFVKAGRIDASISWTAFMGGVAQGDREFIVRQLFRALKTEGILVESNAGSGSQPPLNLAEDPVVRREVLLMTQEGLLSPRMLAVLARVTRHV